MSLRLCLSNYIAEDFIAEIQMLFLNSLASNSFIPYILHPTRIASYSKTLIDNIFSNFITHEKIW